MSTIEKILVGIVVSVASALILAFVTGEFPQDGGNSGDSETTEAVPRSGASSTPQQDPAPAPDPVPSPDPVSSPDPEPSGCTITIENPLVTMYESPDMFGLEVGRIAPGTYSATESTVVTFAGSEQRWFRVAANGQSGWIHDSTILIASKSSQCA